MNSNSSHDRSSDPEAALDRLFQVRELASRDFSARTLAAVQAKARRARVIRFSAWTTAAACAAFALALNFAPVPGGVPQLAEQSALQPVEGAAAPTFAAPAELSAVDELTLALQAASEQEAAFYTRALALEELLADAAVLTEDDGQEALDFLILLADG